MERFPELLTVESYNDDGHLNYVGMQLFSRRLADALANLFASGALKN